MSHPVKQILQECGYKLADAGKFWKTTAHYRGGKNPTSLSIDKKTGWYWDFSAGMKGPPEELAKLINGTADITNFATYVPIPDVVKIKVVKTFPKECLKRLLPDYDLFLDRGISEATLQEFEAGMAQQGKMNRRVCFPIYDRRGRICGFSGRWHEEEPPKLKEGKLPKWKHLNPATSFIFPCHLNDAILREKKRIIIVESIGDLLALWDAGIKEVLCSFGTSLSTALVNYIIGIDPKEIIIATNNDLAVENTPEQEKKGPAAAKRMKKKLAKMFSIDKIFIYLPTKKDFGIMSKREILDWYEAITR